MFCGEVIESNFWHVRIRIWQGKVAPALGSLVVCSDGEYGWIGVVSAKSLTFSGYEREAWAFGLDYQTCVREHPEVFAHMVEDCSVLICGEMDKKNATVDSLSHSVPLHACVHEADKNLYVLMSKTYEYLGIINAYGGDEYARIEVLARLFKSFYRVCEDKKKFEQEFMDTWHVVSRGDMVGLHRLMRYIETSMVKV